jgi:hypothetical protein
MVSPKHPVRARHRQAAKIAFYPLHNETPMSQIAAKTYERHPRQKSGLFGPGRDGLPHGRATWPVPVTTSPCTTAAPPKPPPGLAECPGNASAPTPREAAAGVDIVFACVGNDADLRSVVLGPDGAFAGMKPGAIFVDHTTASAKWPASCMPKPKNWACTLSTPRSRAARRARKTACSP